MALAGSRHLLAPSLWGGDLVTINSFDEDIFVWNKYKYQDLSNDGYNWGYWIGLKRDPGSDFKSSSSWYWSSGQELTYLNQSFNPEGPGEPNGGSGDLYTHIWGYMEGVNEEPLWNDATNIGNPGTKSFPQVGVAEIPLNLSADLPTSIEEGTEFTVDITLTAGTAASELTQGNTIWYTYPITGVDGNGDPYVDSVTGNGLIDANGQFDDGDGVLGLQITIDKDWILDDDQFLLTFYSDDPNGTGSELGFSDPAAYLDAIQINVDQSEGGEIFNGVLVTTIAIKDASAEVPASEQLTPVQKQKTYSISPSLKILQEGGFLVTTVETSGLSKGTELYWHLSGDGVTAADFSYGSLSGSGLINGDGEFTFAHSLKSDAIQEGDELLNIKLFSDSTFTNQVGSTAYVILEDAGSQSSTTSQPIFKPTEKSSTSDSDNSNQGTSSSQDLFSFFADQIGSKSTDNSLLQQLKISIDWLDVDFNQVTTEKKKNFSWKYVDLGEAGSNTTLSTTDLFQVKAATGDLTSTYSSTDWSLVQLGEFSSETYSSTDWSLVKFGDVTTESKKTMDWSKVTEGFLTNESKTTTDDFQWSINNDTAASGKLSKKTKWSKVNIGEFSTETYSAMDWSQVNIGKFQKFGSSSIDWTEVQFGEFQTKQYKQTNWSQVNIGDFTAEDYSEINWGQVAFKGAKSVNYSALDWSQVDFGDFKTSSFKKVDWSKVQTTDLTSEQYSDINWSQVKFKGSKAPTLSDLDLSLVIGSSSFSKKNAKQIDWSTISTDDISASALSKLSGLGVKKKGTNVAELLKPGSQGKELSFAGVGLAEGGALTTGQESSSSGAEVLLAAVEKQPVLI